MEYIEWIGTLRIEDDGQTIRRNHEHRRSHTPHTTSSLQTLNPASEARMLLTEYFKTYIKL